MRSQERGTTLVEIVVAFAILTVTSFMLAAMVGGAQRMTNLTRERSVAFDAVRSYVATMRGKSVAAIATDASTPADFLPSPPLLTGVQGEVFKVNYESGAKGFLITGTTGSSNANAADVAFPSSEAAALAFPRDLDASGGTTGASVSPSALVVLPCRVKLTWMSQLAGSTTQTAVMYVAFTNP